MAQTLTKLSQTPRDVYYSIGTDQTKNLKERIADVHGANSKVMKAVNELDRYVSDPETRKSSWYWSFYRRVKSGMWCLYPHANDIVRTTMTRQFIDELFNGGYIRAMQALSNECGAKHVSFSQEYADSYGVSIGAVLLLGPRGGATMEFLHFLAAERVHGQHRPGTSPNPLCTEKTRKMWYMAQRTGNWPRIIDENGEEVSMDVAEEQGHLPEGIATALRKLWRRNPALRNYMGINRLSDDIPYQIIEDILDILVRKKFSSLSESDKARYDQIIEDANKQGIEPFYAVYKNLFAKKDRLRPYWNRARKLLYDYSISLWEAKNEIWLAEGKRAPARGIVFRAKTTAIAKPKPRKSKVPGTIYLNNGRYYWIVANKMKPRPLIDPKSKPKVPGCFIITNGRYYWYIPGWVRRQRLMPKGEKFSTKDKTIALRIAKKLWAQIKKNDPELAANIQQHTRINGIATRDRAVAERVAAKMWKHIQEKTPQLAAKILTDNRARSKDHWYAQIVAEQKHRLLGSFQTQAEAEAAYAGEFQKIWGYPPGYNVQCIPKIDKVWPTWIEEKARLASMDEHPRIPVIGQSAQTESLTPMIKQMQKVSWLVRNVILVFDDNSPVGSHDIAIQSRGQRWYAELQKQGKRTVIHGSASIDADTGRIRITIYNQAFGSKRVLAEEIYHIGFKIIRHWRPQALRAIQRWYAHQLRNGADSTFSMPDMFATMMALEESGVTTSLPRNLVKHAQNIFSPANRIPTSVMQTVKASWSLP